MNHSSFLLYPSLLAFTLFASCSKPDADQATTEVSATETSNEVVLSATQFTTAGIETDSISLRELSDVVSANGVLDVPPQNMVSISAPLGGFVKNTELLQGMKVKRGQLLVVMESPDYIQLQQDYLEAKNQLTFLQMEYERQQALAKENVNAAKTLQQSQSAFQSMKAKSEALQAKLKMIYVNIPLLENEGIQSTISIPSPIDGFVTEVHINIGSYVNPADVMFEIIDTEHLHAEAEVFEKDVLKLSKGNRVTIRLANESLDREATVYLIGKEISAERTVRIHCHLQREDVNLLPGMYFSAMIETGNKKRASLPENAFVNFEGQDYCFRVVDKAEHHYEMVALKKGVCQRGYCAVLLPPAMDSKSEFVTKGSFTLLSKLKNQEEED